MTDHYCVMGNPIAHSKSPDIHARFAADCGQAMRYERLLIEHEDFARAARAFFDQGGSGANVTLPFKSEALALADACSDEARLAGAANTLLRRADGQLYADNTDGRGLVRDLRDNLGLSLQDRHILLLGAGGAAAGALLPLLRCQPARITLVNRTHARAEALAQQFAEYGPVQAERLDALSADTPCQLIINATAAGLRGDTPAVPVAAIAADAFGYDMFYADTDTPFRSWCRQVGIARHCDGYGMLVEQAAAAFELWRGMRPPTQALITAHRQGDAPCP